MIRALGLAVIFACALAMGLPAKAQEKSGGVMLTAEDLKKLVEPSLLIAGTHVLKWQGPFADLYVPGGMAYAVYTGSTGAGGPVRGKWRLDGDKFCRTHQFEGERCAHFYRLADGSYEARSVPGEELVSTFRTVSKK